MTTVEKIDALLKYLDMTPTQLANNLGYERANIIFSIRTGKTKYFSPRVAEDICKVFPQINLSWLLSDDENMLVDASRKNKYVPIINIDSVGGMYRLNAVEDISQYVEGYVEYDHAQEGDIAIHQSGESMLPDISSTNILVIRQMKDWEDYFGYGRLFVLELTDGRRITKRVVGSEIDPKRNVLCLSFNPNFPPEELPRTKIRSVWRVLHIGIDVLN